MPTYCPIVPLHTNKTTMLVTSIIWVMMNQFVWLVELVNWHGRRSIKAEVKGHSSSVIKL